LLVLVLDSVLILKFPLILLQAKAVRATFLNHDTARLSDPQIDAPLWRKNQHGDFCQNDPPQTLTQYGIDAGQRENQGFSDSRRCVDGVPCKHEKLPLIHS
jgi:hypothetical protein